MMNKYSFIVPVYNTAGYLNKCLDSLLNQTYKNFEIIIINDGSPDNSINIINDYASKYSNIIVIDKEHEGVSVARNNGIKAATGNYLIFVDSDDYVENDLLENIEKVIEDCQVLRYQIVMESTDGTKKMECKEDGFSTTNGFDAFRYLGNYYFVEPACCYVFERQYFLENNFYFKKGMYHEDFGLIPYVILKARKVKSVSYLGYHYVVRKDNIMNDDYKKTVKKAFDMLEHYKTLRLFSKNVGKKNNLDDFYLSYISNTVIEKAKYLKGDEKKIYIHELKKLKVFDGVLVNTDKRRMKKRLMKLNLNLYLKVSR